MFISKKELKYICSTIKSLWATVTKIDEKITENEKRIKELEEIVLQFESGLKNRIKKLEDKLIPQVKKKEKPKKKFLNRNY